VSLGVGKGQFCPFVDRNHPAGDELYQEGARATHVWFVKSRTVVLSRQREGRGSRERVRAIRFPGTFIGLETIVTDLYLDTARASSEVTICGVGREGIDAWLGPKRSMSRTALEMALRAECQDRIRRSSPDGSAVERVAGWLCVEGPREVMNAIPRRLIADLLGMRPETLSRALAELVKRGAIETNRAQLRIVDDRLLSQIAGLTDKTN
jgi:CRP-like cAMP-binding protein